MVSKDANIQYHLFNYHKSRTVYIIVIYIYNIMEVIVEYVRKLKQNHQTILYKDIRMWVKMEYLGDHRC